MVLCNLCGQENDVSMMYTCCNKGETTYECVNERGCIKKRDEYQKRKKEEVMRKYENDHNQNDIKHLSKEEQFNIKYKYKFEDLEEIPMRYRDASIHYRLPNTDLRFTWCWATKEWSLMSETIRKALQNNTLMQNYLNNEEPILESTPPPPPSTPSPPPISTTESITELADELAAESAAESTTVEKISETIVELLQREQFNEQFDKDSNSLILLPFVTENGEKYYIDRDTDEIYTWDIEISEWNQLSNSDKIRETCKEFILEVNRNSRSIREESSGEEESYPEIANNLGYSRLMELLDTPL